MCAKLISKRPSIVDQILAGEPWPDDLVDAINERPRGPDRSIRKTVVTRNVADFKDLGVPVIDPWNLA